MVLANKLQPIFRLIQKLTIQWKQIGGIVVRSDLFYHFTFWNNLPEEKIALRQDRIHSDSGTHLFYLNSVTNMTNNDNAITILCRHLNIVSHAQEVESTVVKENQLWVGLSVHICSELKETTSPKNCR